MIRLALGVTLIVAGAFAFLGCVSAAPAVTPGVAKAAEGPNAANPASASEPGTDAANLAEEVRQQFVGAWESYKADAWGHDESRPVSRSFYDWYGPPFAITPIDSLDTMILMGLTNQATEARSYIDSHVTFDQDVFVSVFEFTIRLLGGLLSSYELTGDRHLLALAKDLADREMPAFASSTGIPFREVNLHSAGVRGVITNPAEAGTLVLEFGTLSRLTGDPRYFSAARRAENAIYSRRSAIGLVGQSINGESGVWVNPDSSISGGIDSYYEYLLKCARLFADTGCSAMWNESLGAVETYLPQATRRGYWYGHVNMNTGKRTGTIFGALDNYFPAELDLAGDYSQAAALYQSGMKMWNLYGIEPETLDYVAMAGRDNSYPLRPELIESTYYLYETTGDVYYRRAGALMLRALETYCRLPDGGYTVLSNVVTKRKGDLMPSYFFAETMKYLYLLFTPNPPIDFRKVIFNTEAHPLFPSYPQSAN